MTITITGLLVVALASWRTWHLLARDTITEPLRRIAAKLKINKFITCPACLGFWITAAIATAWLTLDHWSITLALFALAAHAAWLAFMLAAAWLSQAVDDLIINHNRISDAQTDAARASVEMAAEARRTAQLYTGRDLT